MNRPRHHIVRRSLRIGAALSLAGALTVAAGIPVAGQEAGEGEATTEESFLPEAFLDGFGWFNKANQAPGGSSTPPPPSCPSSPASQCTVGPPADGIYIAYDSDAVVPPTVTGPVANLPTAPTTPAGGAPQPLGPTAFGAVRYVVPEGAETQLTLKILSRSTTTPGGTDPTAGKVFACIVTKPGWLAAQNARYDQGPTYDCTTADQGDIQGDVVVFDFGTAFIQNGMVDVAIVPAGSDPVNGGDRPFQMAIAAPTDDSLTILNAADIAEESSVTVTEDIGTFEDPSTTDFSAVEESVTVTEEFALPGETSFAADDSVGAIASVPVARPRVQPQVAAPAANVINPFRKDASRGERMMAVALLLAIATGLWWVGGQPVRPPRLLGSLGAAAPAGASATRAATARGIGRFARTRTAERPPRLF